MLTTRDLKTKTIIEVVNQTPIYYGDINTIWPNLKDPLTLLPTEQYEIVSEPKKQKKAYIFTLKQINGDKKGEIYMVYLQDNIKIISTPEASDNEDSQLKLHSDEELVLVKKNTLPYLFLSKTIQTNSAQADTNEIIENTLVFNKKIGKRKKFPSIFSLYGYLNNNTGLLSQSNWREFFDEKSKKGMDVSEECYNLFGFNAQAKWMVPDYLDFIGFTKDSIEQFIEDLKNVEVRKYNIDTKKVSNDVVDFDCYEYIKKYVNSITTRRLFGSAIVKIIDKLSIENEFETYPYILSIKPNYHEFRYYHEIPVVNDQNFKIIVQELKLKKKDIVYHNDKEALAIAFASKETLEKFKNKYPDNGNIIKQYNIHDILHHPEIDQTLFIKKTIYRPKFK